MLVHTARPRTRSSHFTPLRYPGGKAKLAEYIKTLITSNQLSDGDYVEPYAGSAAVGLELLFHEYVSYIHINDASRYIHAFWKSVLDKTETFCRLVMSKSLTVEEWDIQKGILRNSEQHDDLEVGFATFYLNRTNRSGILNGGIIGGRQQSGPWKIDARFNARELVRRIEAIGRLRERIKVTGEDALEFLKQGVAVWPRQTLIYLDPPYYVKGKDLYHHFYKHEDHLEVAQFVAKSINTQKWVVSYDNVVQIRELYPKLRNITYDIGYSARAASQGSEIMFFSNGLLIPPLKGPVKLTQNNTDQTRFEVMS